MLLNSLVSRNGNKGRCLICLLTIIHRVGWHCPWLQPILPAALSLPFSQTSHDQRARGWDCWLTSHFLVFPYLRAKSNTTYIQEERIQGKHLPAPNLWSTDQQVKNVSKSSSVVSCHFLALFLSLPPDETGDIQMHSHLLQTRLCLLLNLKTKKHETEPFLDIIGT